MKPLLLLGFLLLLSPLSSGAQNQKEIGLVLRGQLSGGKATYENGKVVWSGTLTMEFVNKGSKPVVLINPNYAFGTGLSRVEFVFQYGKSRDGYSKVGGEEAVGWTKVTSASEQETDALKSSFGILDSPKPPDNITLVLAAGSTISFEEVFSFEQKITVLDPEIARETKRASLMWEDAADWFKESEGYPDSSRQIGLGLGDARHIKLTYKFSLAESTTAAPEALEKLAARWKNFGAMPLDANGDYFVVSEPIVINRDFEKVNWPEDRRTGLKFWFPFYTF